MAFDPGSAAVVVKISFSNGDIAYGTGFLISENQVLTAAHVVNDTDGASTVSGLSVFTGGPSNNFVSNPAYTFHGTEISVDMENVYSNGIPNPGNLTEDYISKDVAVMNLTERARFGNTLLGWLSLIPSAEFVESGSSGTIYGYPYNANGTSGQAQTTASLEGPYAPNGGSGETAYYVSETATEPGESGGAVVLEFSVAEGAPETYGVVGVNSAASEDEGYFAALTDMTVGMIEYWRSLGGNSPLSRRLYTSLLGREPDDLAGSSAAAADFQRQTAAALGKPFATAMEICEQFPQSTTASILGSAEFTGAHPNISDADLVQLLYNNSLGRPADNFEVNYWTTKGYDQATIANMIINSPEAIIRSGIAGQAGF